MVSCHDVLRELSNFIDGEVDHGLRQQIEEHLKGCHRCSVLVDSTRKVLYVVGDERVFEVPVGYSDRLHRLIEERLGHR
jgi:anti-sigma factor RsiW